MKRIRYPKKGEVVLVSSTKLDSITSFGSQWTMGVIYTVILEDDKSAYRVKSSKGVVSDFHPYCYRITQTEIRKRTDAFREYRSSIITTANKEPHTASDVIRQLHLEVTNTARRTK